MFDGRSLKDDNEISEIVSHRTHIEQVWKHRGYKSNAVTIMHIEIVKVETLVETLKYKIQIFGRSIQMHR